MSAKSVTRSRRLIARLGSVLAAALCVGSLAVFSPSASAASKNPDITSGEVYRIVNLGSGHCLNVTGGRDQDNINVNQYTEDSTNTQDFIIRWISAESCYKIYPVCSSNGSGRVLHIARSGSAPANGGNAVIKTASSADAASQRFQIDTVGHNLFTIRLVSKPSLYLTANGTGNGTWSGTGANTAGNVVAKSKVTVTKNNKDEKVGYQEWRQQQWIITEKTRYSSYVLQIPLEYENGSAYTTNGLACSGHNACITYSGGEQCVAFSREVYARNNGGFRWSNTNATEKEGISTTNLSELKAYIKNHVGYGGHVWVTQSRSQHEHSIIIADFSDTEIRVYDANAGGDCMVRDKSLTYKQFASNYPKIKYSHKGQHNHNRNTYKPISSTQHAKFCPTCNLPYDASTVANHSLVRQGNLMRCQTCHFSRQIAEETDISTPEETGDAPEPEEPFETVESHPEEPTLDSSAEISAEDSFTEESSAEDVSGEEASAEESPTENSSEEASPDSSHPLDPALLPEENDTILSGGDQS